MRWWQRECYSMAEEKKPPSCMCSVLIPEGFAAGS